MHVRFDNCPAEHIRTLVLTSPSLAFKQNSLSAFVIRLMLCGRSLVNWFSASDFRSITCLCDQNFPSEVLARLRLSPVFNILRDSLLI
ncbi:MAG: hypothetical protein ACTS4W_01100 [Candidatus Hodgkinia cicadicola]